MAYAFLQLMSPGPGCLMNISTEADLNSKVSKVVEKEFSFEKAVAIADPAQRAEMLRAIVISDYPHLELLAFAELGKCGTDALPVLRGMLNDDSLLDHHGEIIFVLGRVGGIGVAPDLTRLVENETVFWKKTAGNLKPGWWNVFPVPLRVDDSRNHYARLRAALRALEGLNFEGCKSAVTDLRDFWRSLPQLDEINSHQMSQACDHVLKSIH